MSEPKKYAGRLLIVDDEPSMRSGLAALLTQQGFQVRTADGGEEALALLAEEPVDLVVTDRQKYQWDLE